MTALTDDEPFTFDSASAAGAACGVSKKTILRKAVKLAEAGATKDEKGNWRITPQQLRDVGLHPGGQDRVESVPEKSVAAVTAIHVPASRPMSPPPAPPSQLMSPIDAAFLSEYAAMRARIVALEGERDELREERDHYRTQWAVAQAVANERFTHEAFMAAIASIQSRRTWWGGTRKQLPAGPQQ